MNVSTIKTLLFLISLGLFGGLGYFAYQHRQLERWVYWDRDQAKTVLDTVVRPETPEARIVNYKEVVTPVLITFDWTGAPPKKVADAPVEEVGPIEKPKTVVAEILTVLQTQVDTGDPGGSHALVFWKKPELKDRNPFLRIGHVLPAPYDSAVVKDIRVDGVVEFAFTRDDQENEIVTMPRNPDLIVFVDDEGKVRQPPPRRVFPTATPAAFAGPERTRRSAVDMYDMGREDLKMFADDYPRILTEDVSLETHYKDGVRSGLKIKSVKAGSLAAQHGAVAGDVIISINGHAVTSDQEAIKYVKNNSNTTSVWQVVIESLGRQRTVTYNSPNNSN
jgi:hypothetical protein